MMGTYGLEHLIITIKCRSLVNNCKDFGNLTDKSIRIFTGDFTGAVDRAHSIIPVTATGGTAPL